MATQATLTNGRPTRQESDGMLGGMGSFGSNVVNLALLQGRLAALDLVETGRKSRAAIVVLMVALLALPSALVVGAIGLGLWLAGEGGLPVYQAFLIVGLGIVSVATVGAVVSALVIKKSLQTFRRSTEELERNVAWLRTVLTQSGRR